MKGKERRSKNGGTIHSFHHRNGQSERVGRDVGEMQTSLVGGDDQGTRESGSQIMKPAVTKAGSERRLQRGQGSALLGNTRDQDRVCEAVCGLMH